MTELLRTSARQLLHQALLARCYESRRLADCWAGAEGNWRRLRGFNYLAKVTTGVTFKDAIEVTTTDPVAA